MRVLIWIDETTWEGCIDAAAPVVPPDADVTILYVIPSDAAALAAGGGWQLLGRGLDADRVARQLEEAAEDAAQDLLRDALARWSRPARGESRWGRPEREVVAAAAGKDLLVVARAGDISRLGPHSLGKQPRFVVDHAPCPVLLVWPGDAPPLGSMPPPPPHGPHGPHGHGPHGHGPHEADL
jgi:nucleotide-binding universal stress UspA family protein